MHIYDGHDQVYEGVGSIPRIIRALAENTAEIGHDVTVVERRWSGQPTTDHRDGVDIRRLSLRTGETRPDTRIPYEVIGKPIEAAKFVVDRTNFAIAVLRALRNVEPDVLHVHLPFMANVLVTIAPWLRDRIVYTAHIGETKQRIEEMRVSPDVYLAKRVAVTAVLNPSMRRAFENRSVPSDRLTFVPNGVYPDQFESTSDDQHRDAAESLGINESPLVLYAGTITPRKGVVDLALAADEIVNERGHDDVQFFLVGNTSLDPEYVDRIESIISERDLGRHVSLPGLVTDEELEALYSLADVFVLPSVEEGFPMVVNEAMAAYTPIVASRIDGPAQQVRHSREGFLYEQADIEDLANDLSTLLEDDELRARMSEAARDRAEEFSWENVADHYANIYEHLLEHSQHVPV